MNLLPKSREDFGTKSYWEDFFKKRKDAFEWYGEYPDLCGVLHKYCKLTDKILMAGCGNSQLSEAMYDVGFHKLVNIDISDVVIKQMKKKNENKRAEMEYLKMDIKQMSFEEEEFNVVLDKGTLDAIFTDNSSVTVAGVQKMLTEIHRVLKVGGRYICVTLAQNHILNQVLTFFANSWFIRVHRIEIFSKVDDEGLGGRLPVFAFVFTKMMMELPRPVLELIVSESSNLEKFQTIEDIKEAIENLQNFAIIQNKLVKASLEETVTVDLWSNDIKQKEPRYSITIVDVTKSALSAYNGRYAIFIVAQGRENEFTFATKKGQVNLAEAAGFLRLAITSLHRGHIYKDLDEIKAELSEKVLDLAPPGVGRNTQVPFLMASSDVGNREVIQEGESELHGTFIVEDVQSADQYYYRQLIFRNDMQRVQAKVRLKIAKSSKKKAKSKKRIADHRYLMSDYHKATLASFSLLTAGSIVKTAKISQHQVICEEAVRGYHMILK